MDPCASLFSIEKSQNRASMRAHFRDALQVFAGSMAGVHALSGGLQGDLYAKGQSMERFVHFQADKSVDHPDGRWGPDSPPTTMGGSEITSAHCRLRFVCLSPQISIITGITMGRRPVFFWIRRFNSTRTFSLTMP
jgi:hypothetical protein